MGVKRWRKEGEFPSMSPGVSLTTSGSRLEGISYALRQGGATVLSTHKCLWGAYLVPGRGTFWVSNSENTHKQKSCYHLKAEGMSSNGKLGSFFGELGMVGSHGWESQKVNLWAALTLKACGNRCRWRYRWGSYGLMPMTFSVKLEAFAENTAWEGR